MLLPLDHTGKIMQLQGLQINKYFLKNNQINQTPKQLLLTLCCKVPYLNKHGQKDEITEFPLYLLILPQKDLL